MIEHRDNRDMSSLCVTCAGQNYRDERDTPLGGVTVVTLARVAAETVPMPGFSSWGGVAVVGVPVSLRKIRGET